jgi:hypothetical protein
MTWIHVACPVDMQDVNRRCLRHKDLRASGAVSLIVLVNPAGGYREAFKLEALLQFSEYKLLDLD